jgi:hypothetical protein
MLSVYSRLLVILLLVPALAGCGGGDDKPAAEQPQKTGETEDLAAYEVESGGFTLSVPREWKAVNIDEILDAGGLDALREEDPELARQVEPLAQPGSPVKFVAIDPDVQDDFATNANVYVEETPAGVTRDQYFDASVDRISEAIGAPQQERTSLPAGEALRLSYEQELDSGRRLAMLQYLLFEDETGYVITYTTLPDRSAEYAETFETSARSFGLL